MNKRFVAFLNELAQENEDLERRYHNALIIKENFTREISTQNKQIKELKAKIRELKRQQKEGAK